MERCWGLWPLLALGLLIFAVWEVAKHIHIEQEGILLQAIDLRVEVFTPTSGTGPGTKTQTRRDSRPDALSCLGPWSSVCPLCPFVPWAQSRVLELPQQTIDCWGGRLRRSWSLPVGLRSLWPQWGEGPLRGGQDVQPR